MMKKFEGNSEEMQFERFERFEKLLKKNKNKPNFEEMSPYEIINYLREEDVRKNYKVLPSNRFFKKMMFSSFFAIFLVFFYVITGSGDIVQRNVDVFVNKIDNKKEVLSAINNSLDYIIEGDFRTLIDAYRSDSSNSFENHFELVIMLSSINNFSQAEEELLKLKGRVEQITLIRNDEEHKNNVYGLLDNFLLLNNLEEAKNILDKNRQSLGNDILFLEREIIYFLLMENKEEAINIYSSIMLDNIEDVNSILCYAKLSVIFNRFDRAIEALDKVLSKDINNINVLSVIDMMVSYDLNELNRTLDSYIEQSGGNERLRLLRAKANSKDLSRTQINIEDIDEFMKKYPNQNLPKIVKLEILTDSSRFEEATRLYNELKNMQDKAFDVYYALAKYSLSVNNFNDALNYVKQSIELNNKFYESYDVLLNILLSQNKSLNINYFYLKMKLLDLINTNIDKNFVVRYTDSLNDGNKAIEVLEFANKISIFESDLRYKLAKIYIDQRRDNEAKEKLYEAISLNEKSVYYRTLGVLLVGMGEVEEGINNIRMAYSIDPEDILNLNNAGAYYANVEKDIQRAFSNVKAAYEGLNESYSEYEALIIRENYFKLDSIYDEASGTSTSEEIPFIDYLY